MRATGKRRFGISAALRILEEDDTKGAEYVAAGLADFKDAVAV